MKKLRIATIAAVITALLISTGALALFFTNGSFETGSWTPGWDGAGQRTFRTFTGGYTAGFPNLSADGTGADLSAIVGGPTVAAMSLSDPNTLGNLKYPAFGHYSARINSQLAYTSGGHGMNANTLYQTTSVTDPDDISPDGKVHLRLMYAPVLVEPSSGHTADQVPMYFLEVRDVTAGTVVFSDQAYVGDLTHTWLTGAAFSGGGYWKYMDWQLVDTIVGDGSGINSVVGHTLSVQVVATGCSLGGHPGYVYVDEVGSKLPPPLLWVGAPATTYPNPATYTYTINYSVPADRTDGHMDLTVPTGTTYVPASLSDANCSEAAGAITCDWATIATGAHAFTFNVQVNSGVAVDTVLKLETYSISTAGSSVNTGTEIDTTVVLPPPGAFNKSAPSNSATGVSPTPTLSWDTSSDAVSYQYCIGNGSGLCNVVNWTTAASPVTIGAGILSANSTYYWQVHAINPSGTTLANGGTWWSFDTVPPPPTITGIVPDSGPMAGGTSVGITGTNLTGGDFTFGGYAASCTINSATSATCTTPTGAHAGVGVGGGAVDVVVTTGGGSDTSIGGFTYYAVPAIDVGGVTGGPGSTTGGTTVTITGQHFTGTTHVHFGDDEYDIVAGPDLLNGQCKVVDDSHIVCKTKTHAGGTVDVIVSTPGGDSNAGSYTFVNPPTITSLSPRLGSAFGSTDADNPVEITITGTYLTDGVFTFGGYTATCTILSATSAKCILPAGTDAGLADGSGGDVDVFVTTAGGEDSDIFTYVNIGTKVGSVNGGTHVTITGVDLRGSLIYFGSQRAACTFNAEGTEAYCITKTGTAGQTDVLIYTLHNGRIDILDGFTYVAIPGFDCCGGGILPNTGSILGGTAVTIYGHDLKDGTFTFGGTLTDAPCTFNEDYTEAYCVTPAHAAGAVSVVITTPGGTAILRNCFTYIEATIFNGDTGGGITPNTGSTLGGDAFTITGTHLNDFTLVTFGGFDITSTCAAANSEGTLVNCSATPAHEAGAVDVVVVTPNGTATSLSGFTYVAPLLLPTITSVVPNSGPISGGTTVVITGTNLNDFTSVTFGGKEAASACTLTVANTELTCVTPAHNLGLVDVSVTTTAGGPVTATGAFTYIPVTFYSVGGYDGTMIESKHASGIAGVLNSSGTTITVGDTKAKQQYRSMLHFNTSPLPNAATITKVQLKVKISGKIVGNNPSLFTAFQGLYVDIRVGSFAGPYLGKADFSRNPASKNLAGKFGNTPTDGWYTLNLSSSMFKYVSKTTSTQFRLRFKLPHDADAVADYVKFYSGNSTAANWPQLIVTYTMP